MIQKTSHTIHTKRKTRFLILLLCATVSFSFIPFSWADSQEADLEKLSQEVEESAKRYDEAINQQSQIDDEIDELKKQISICEKKLPEQEEHANDASITLYKLGDVNLLVDMLLESTSFTEAISIYDSYNAIAQECQNQLRETKDLKEELYSSKETLEQKKEDADNALKEANAALETAKTARQKAQEEAEAREAALREAEAKRQQEKNDSICAKLIDDIDWTLSKDEFVETWSKRIDAYLDGSPLSGYGKLFAESSWNYGTDPRWSPAISCLESGKGSVCFRNHNAWGWMGHSFSSWEEAIPQHVEYLAGPLYGGYISQTGAATYCPPGDYWFDFVSNEMTKI